MNASADKFQLTDECVCPNGHSFPRAVTVDCEEEGCGAKVVCVPHSDAMRLHEALEAAEARIARLVAVMRYM